MHQKYNSLSDVCFDVNLANRMGCVCVCIKQAVDDLEMSVHYACFHLHHMTRF